MEINKNIYAEGTCLEKKPKQNKKGTKKLYEGLLNFIE